MNRDNHYRYWLRLSLLLILLVSFSVPPLARTQRNPFSVPVVNAAATTPWLDAQQSGEIVYLLFASPPSIKRYQVSTQSWLSDLSLSGTPTAFRVTADALYVAFGLRAAKLSLDGTGETHLLNTIWNIISLHVTIPSPK